MRILHLSMECYPAAKAGGLGDVVGALPKYQQRLGHQAEVLMPAYANKWVEAAKTELVFETEIDIYGENFPARINKVIEPDLGFSFYLLHLPGFFDRSGIYIDSRTGKGYSDEAERNLAYQKAAAKWVLQRDERPDLVHCHDHHTSLIPFIFTECYAFSSLRSIPTVLTIHNGMYQGGMGWDRIGLIPAFHPERGGLLEWNQHINPLACGIKCAWSVTTVSPGYMEELSIQSRGLEMLFRMESAKCQGIINGIDNETWDPRTDPELLHHLDTDELRYKRENKKQLCDQLGFDPDRALITFIGRFATEKGADLLPDIIDRAVEEGLDAQFFVLGSGDHDIQRRIEALGRKHPTHFKYEFAYNEPLSRLLYAGSNFLIMPSRVEPCGLNQLYAFRYGTIPIVHAVGGLKDTVQDFDGRDGNGFTFSSLQPDAIQDALRRAVSLYNDHLKYEDLLDRNMGLDHSWESATENYISLYSQLINKQHESHAV